MSTSQAPRVTTTGADARRVRRRSQGSIGTPRRHRVALKQQGIAQPQVGLQKLAVQLKRFARIFDRRTQAAPSQLQAGQRVIGIGFFGRRFSVLFKRLLRVIQLVAPNVQVPQRIPRRTKLAVDLRRLFEVGLRTVQLTHAIAPQSAMVIRALVARQAANQGIQRGHGGGPTVF